MEEPLSEGAPYLRALYYRRSPSAKANKEPTEQQQHNFTRTISEHEANKLTHINRSTSKP